MQSTETSHSSSGDSQTLNFSLQFQSLLGLKVQEAKSRCYPRESQKKISNRGIECCEGLGATRAVQQCLQIQPEADPHLDYGLNKASYSEF